MHAGAGGAAAFRQRLALPTLQQGTLSQPNRDDSIMSCSKVLHRHILESVAIAANTVTNRPPGSGGPRVAINPIAQPPSVSSSVHTSASQRSSPSPASTSAATPNLGYGSVSKGSAGGKDERKGGGGGRAESKYSSRAQPHVDEENEADSTHSTQMAMAAPLLGPAPSSNSSSAGHSNSHGYSQGHSRVTILEEKIPAPAPQQSQPQPSAGASGVNAGGFRPFKSERIRVQQQPPQRGTAMGARIGSSHSINDDPTAVIVVSSRGGGGGGGGVGSGRALDDDAASGSGEWDTESQSSELYEQYRPGTSGSWSGVGPGPSAAAMTPATGDSLAVAYGLRLFDIDHYLRKEYCVVLPSACNLTMKAHGFTCFQQTQKTFRLDTPDVNKIYRFIKRLFDKGNPTLPLARSALPCMHAAQVC
jgi:hypothetical protein